MLRGSDGKCHRGEEDKGQRQPRARGVQQMVLDPRKNGSKLRYIFREDWLLAGENDSWRDTMKKSQKMIASVSSHILGNFFFVVPCVGKVVPHRLNQAEDRGRSPASALVLDLSLGYKPVILGVLLAA